MTTDLKPVLSRLGGWPSRFTPREKFYGGRMLATLVARKTVDEAIFDLIKVYARERALWERWDDTVRTDDTEKARTGETSDHKKYMTGAMQRRAMHKNVWLDMQRELLATPAARSRAGENIQSDFLSDLLKTDTSSPYASAPFYTVEGGKAAS